MAVVPKGAAPDYPSENDAGQFLGAPTGNISVGDFLVFSGANVIAASANGANSNKASAAGISLNANPVTDQFGTSRQQNEILVLRQGIIRAKMLTEGTINAGQPVAPVTTGSGYNMVTGNTGVPAYWSAVTPVSVSGATGAAPSPAKGICIAYHGDSSTSGEIDVLINMAADGYY